MRAVATAVVERDRCAQSAELNRNSMTDFAACAGHKRHLPA
jgi:hypothetical protein